MITAQLASIPSRENSLKLTVESLRNQVDKILVALNGYDHIPEFLNNGEFVMLDNSRGDAAKFFDVEYLQDYIFTCDDDIIYPRLFIETILDSYKKQNKDIITLYRNKNKYEFDSVVGCGTLYTTSKLVPFISTVAPLVVVDSLKIYLLLPSS